MAVEGFDYRDNTPEATQQPDKKNPGRIIKKYAPALALAGGAIALSGGIVDNQIFYPDHVQTQLAQEGHKKPPEKKLEEAKQTIVVFKNVAIDQVRREGSFTPTAEVVATINEATNTIETDDNFNNRKDVITSGKRPKLDVGFMFGGALVASVAGTIQARRTSPK